MIVQQIRGCDLSDDDITFMNRRRIIEYGENTKDFRRYEQDSLFFFLRQYGHIAAFGMLKPVRLTFDTHHADILGIGNIIAVQKGQGLGRRLMSTIQDYLLTEKMVGLGFCYAEVCGFYAACGLDIVTTLTPKFRYAGNRPGAIPSLTDPQIHVLCYDPDTSLLSQLVTWEGTIKIDVPFW